MRQLRFPPVLRRGPVAPTCVPSSHRPSPAPTHGHSFADSLSTFSLRLADGADPRRWDTHRLFLYGCRVVPLGGPLADVAWTTVLDDTPLPALKPRKAMANEAPLFSVTDGRTDGRSVPWTDKCERWTRAIDRAFSLSQNVHNDLLFLPQISPAACFFFEEGRN